MLPLRGTALGFLFFAWDSVSKASAATSRALVGGVVGLLILNLAVNIGFNHWHRWFFDMLEQREAGKLFGAIVALSGLIVSGAAFAVSMMWCRMTLQLELRRVVTIKLIDMWIARSKAGEFHVANENHGSPAFRLAEDVRLALDPVVDLGIGFANAAILGATFVGILIVVGGSMTLELASFRLTIPAYLAIAAVAYAAVLSLVMHLVGQPLIRCVAEKNESEAQFLFELTREVEGRSLTDHGTNEDDAFEPAAAAFARVARQWHRVIREYCRLTWLTNSHSFFAPILPLLLAYPKYLSGELSLGAIMQLAAAFTTVLGALNWFTDNYVRIAEWSASARRADELRHGLLPGAVAPTSHLGSAPN